jgi:hypothetical protein
MPPTSQDQHRTTDDLVLDAVLSSWRRLDSSSKGIAGESCVTSYLAALGMNLWRPVSAGSRADLGVLTTKGFIKLQIRVAGYIQSRRCFMASLVRKIKGRRVPFRKNDIDFFCCVCPGPKPWIYFIPATATAGRSSATFSPHRYRRLRQGTIDWGQYLDAVHLLSK